MGAVRTLQAYTNEKLAGTRFRAAVERAYQAAVASTRARAMLTAIIIFLVFASVVIILWVGAQDVLAGRSTPGRLGQFVLYAAFAAGGLSQLSDVWGELSQTAGAAERIAELLAIAPGITAPQTTRTGSADTAGRSCVRSRALRLSGAAAGFVLDGVSFAVAAGEKVALVGPRARARALSSICSCASTTRPRAA